MNYFSFMVFSKSKLVYYIVVAICDQNPKVFSARYLHLSLVPKGGSSLLQIFSINQTWRNRTYCFVGCLMVVVWLVFFIQKIEEPLFVRTISSNIYSYRNKHPV